LFNETAKFWTEQYANPEKVMNDKMKDLLEMGFSDDDCREALTKFNMDKEKSINYLLNK